MSGKICTTCDRLFWHEDNRIATYVKKDDSEWSQISDIIKESVESKGLTKEDLEKFIREAEFNVRL
jgi:hypothetical protein